MLIAVWQTYAAHLPPSLSAVDGRVRDGSRRKYRLAQTLCGQRYGLSIVLLGSEPDATLAGEVEVACGQGVTNLVGRTSLKEAVGIIARAKVAVGPDTGLMHIAAAVGTPVISLWGATSPSRTGPYGFEDLVIQGKADCSPCYRRHCPIGRVCMQSIEVETIMAKIEIGLSRKWNGAPAYETQL